ncbi:MAG: lipid A Kdo2 1-phosphate O-methyltransferase [SAR324 cluster bacterium]|jgi:protein-S-isoprenylcysteine O-methyltransferase Ste14|nr:lipid A Kdo2 1-phosphate O-methyltransferase [SAR324 cluster bacterium]MCH2265491.1 lipid A Kdo2 1-phosphate O-methyltransferase [SAR324 cluster bacterium]
MQLEKKLVSSGYWLFRWRSYFPIIIILIFIPAMTEYEYVGGSREMTTMWGLFSMFVGLLGLFSRILVVGHTPQNTSGRNTREQIADVLNTTGWYSVVRHPLYLGNYLMGLGISLFPFVWWMPVIYTLSFALYYERIMIAEEDFLRGKFGEDFEKWSDVTPGFFPAFSKWDSPSLEFSFKNILRREYSSLFALVLCFTILDFIGNYLVVQRFYVVQIWIDLFWITLVAYLILRTLKRYTKILDVEGR